MRPAALTLFLGLSLAALPGCALTRAVGLGPELPPDAPAAGDSAEVLYGKAERLFAAKAWEDAGDAFHEVWERHPNAELASDAQFYEAESRYGQGKYHGAFQLYKAYLKDHPLSPHAPLIQRRLYDIGTWTIVEGAKGFLGVFEYADEGIEELEYLVQAFPNGDLADDALIYMADYEWQDRRPQDAILHLHDLVDHYPASEWALEARLRLAKAYRDVNRGTPYDADALQRSAAQYRAYVELVSADANRAREYAELLEGARQELRGVEEELARKGLLAADYYLRTGKPEAARAELRNVVRDYPETPAAAEAARRLSGDPAAAPETKGGSS